MQKQGKFGENLNAEETKVYICSQCGRYYTSKETAEQCCLCPPKVCEDCGVELDPKCYFTTCKSCREKRRYNRCRKVTIKEYEKEFSDCMVVSGTDYYFSVEDALESNFGFGEEVPHYVYGTEKRFIKVDIEKAIEWALADVYEDADFSNTDELYKFVDKWNERNKLTMFCETRIVIDIPEALRKEYM